MSWTRPKRFSVIYLKYINRNTSSKACRMRWILLRFHSSFLPLQIRKHKETHYDLSLIIIVFKTFRYYYIYIYIYTIYTEPFDFSFLSVRSSLNVIRPWIFLKTRFRPPSTIFNHRFLLHVAELQRKLTTIWSDITWTRICSCWR